MKEQQLVSIATSLYCDHRDMDNAYFAQAEHKPDGTFEVCCGRIDGGNMSFFKHVPGLTLDQAMDRLDKWERFMNANSGEYSVSGNRSLVGIPNFRDIGRKLGMPVGPEEKSLHHAAKAKRAVRARRKQMSPR